MSIKTVFGVGVSYANYSTMVRKYFPEAEIYAFEPHSDTFIELQEKSKKYNLHIYNLGVSDRLGYGKLWDFKDKKFQNLTFPSLYKGVIEKVHKRRAKFQEIKLTTLDDFVKTNSIRKIDLLKIDTKGSEPAILKGAMGLIKNKKIKIIQFEFNEMNAISRTFLKDFIERLEGYKLYRIQIDGLTLIENYDPKTHEIFAFQNIMAVLPSVARKLQL